MTSAMRVFLVRASVLVPAEGLPVNRCTRCGAGPDSEQHYAGTVDGHAFAGRVEADGELIAQSIRAIVHGELEANALTVRMSMALEITNGVNLGAVEPTDPADVHSHVLPNPAAVAAVYRKLQIDPTHQAYTFDDVHALVGEIDRWRTRCAARLETPEGREVFNQACGSLLAGALGLGKAAR